MKTTYLLLCLLGIGSVSGAGQTKQPQKIGDFIESTSYNEHRRNATRSLQYTPDGDDFVCINGKNRFTRALYGSHTAFRLETSDRPVFAAYTKENPKHICFKLQTSGGTVALDSTEHCESRYTAGRRSYSLSDPAFGGGSLSITTWALPDKEGAIWQFNARNFKEFHPVLLASISEIRNSKLNRNGDMGADPADSFEAPLQPQQLQSFPVQIDGTLYILLENQELRTLTTAEGENLFKKAEAARSETASRIRIETPDPYFNTLGGTLAMAADGIWDGEVWLHGAIGWRMPLSGWRAAYTGDVLGWHDRARTHFNAYAASQVTEVPNTLPHPAQDSALHLARSVKKWGTPQYSNGYICRNPHRNNQMHHYDMNLCYIDELLWHFKWTGDLDYVRQMWPVITRHLAWEKLNYDPDNDGLYDAYACIWASDALYYNSGAVTHSSAYNYRANKTAAQLAEKIGEDPTPYRNEAEKILKAMNERLWLPGKGHWAEYQDFMGHKRVHESAAVWTIYHAIDSETANPFQAYQATRYVDTAHGLKENGYATIATTNWLPYSWSINNVAFAEVMHTALSYFQAGRADAGYKLLKSSVLDGMYLGDSPGNFGQISFYDAARGECYRDFGDPIGVASRVLIQGLFGILPDALNKQIILRPGFPADWDKASVSTPDISYRFTRKEDTDTYHITQRFQTPLHPVLQINARKEKIRSVKVNDVPATWQSIESAHGYPLLSIQAEGTSSTTITIEWEGAPLHTLAAQEPVIASNGKLALQIPSGASISQVYDPQSVLAKHTMGATAFNAQIKGEPGHHTFFVYTHQGEMDWWQPVNIYIENTRKAPSYTDFADIRPEKCRMVDFDRQLNASVTDIYQNEYLSPRSPYTTLQLPTQGIGEWCHPLLTATIDDSELRSLVHHDTFQTSLGIPFRLKEKGNNILFTSLWDNYPDSSTISLSGTASHAYLLMAGSTNHMQCHIANGIIRIHYADGTSQATELTNPDNWCPIEQDFYVDGKAFQATAPRPYRLHLRSGKISRDLGKELNITGVYGREIEGGAGILLDIPLDHSKELKGLTLETLSNDVVIGIMGITLQ
ncbi:DUF4450 domain-containing protein [Phocaeicola vulgatus]|nr:DUF4450 domain-containing protein [Phocaeicola vulgatus]